MILESNGDITLEKCEYLNPINPYAVFVKVRTATGKVMFLQQKSKWYAYEKCARKQYLKICNNLIGKEYMH